MPLTDVAVRGAKHGMSYAKQVVIPIMRPLRNHWCNFMRALFLVFVYLQTWPALAEEPRVAATVKPLHSLVAGVMQGVGEPWLLVRGELSPHDAALTPSDTRRMREAEIVFYMGQGFDGYLLASLGGPDAPVLVSMAREDRDGLHLWLDPAAAARIVERAAEALSARYPADADLFARNATRMGERLQAMDEALQQRLASVRGRPFIVAHDAYGPFVRHFGLTAPEPLAASPESPPGPRRFRTLRAKVAAGEIACILGEPHGWELVERLAAGTPARIVQADPDGLALEPGPELYFTLMEGLAGALVQCLMDS